MKSDVQMARFFFIIIDLVFTFDIFDDTSYGFLIGFNPYKDSFTEIKVTVGQITVSTVCTEGK